MTHLTKVGATYYYRRVVPQELRPYFLTAAGKPRTEFMVSLRTKDRPLATERCNLEAVKHDRLIRDARSKLKAGVAPERVQGPPSATPAPARNWNPFPNPGDLERFEEEQAFWMQEDLADQHDPVRREILAGIQEGLARREQQDREFAAELAAERAAEAKPPEKKTRLGTVVDQWAAELTPDQKTIDRMVAVASWFEKHAGRTAIEDITPDQVLAFKDHLLTSTSEANAQTKLRNLNTLLRYAKNRRRIIALNPAEGITITIKAKAGERRREFDADALSALFGSPVYSDSHRPDAGCGEAAYWLPLLGLYTGARLNEIGQLRPEDVRQETYIDTDGEDRQAWVLRLTADQQAGLKLKNVGSERRVPVHPDLIALGFLTYVERAASQERLFPELKPDKYGTVTASWSKWFNRYLRLTCRVTDTRVVFHSFRHSFKHYARNAFIPKDVHDAITGHASSDAGDGYGGLSHPLAPLVEAMRKYRVPGFKLPAPPPGLTS